MSGDPLAERSAKLLAALDFSAEAAAREARHRQELAALLRSFLDVADSFDRLLAGGEAAVPRPTVELLARQLTRCLEGAGVAGIPCLGEAVDPRVHEIAGTRPDEETEPDIIVEVVSGGYLWNGELLRRPRVVVAARGKETKP
jgi:molecular chaperone GrpE (heat shock protein)